MLSITSGEHSIGYKEMAFMGVKPRKFNISEIARISGVSTMTVSRTLNAPHKVAMATKTRVLQVIDRVQYRPNPLAQGLVSRRTGILGLMIFDDMDMGFLQPIFLVAEQEIRTSGRDLLIFSQPGKSGGHVSRCLDLVDGVLCFGYEIDNNVIETLEKRGIPYAIIGKREWTKVSPWFISPAYFNSYRDVTRRLLNLGHQRIVFMGGNDRFLPDIEKHSGFHAAFREEGVSGGRSFYDEDVGQVREILETVRPTAVFLENIKFPLPFLQCVKEIGLRIPRDISVIYTRHDFIDKRALYDLAGIHELTLLSVPRRELGIAGTKLLHSLIDGNTDIPKSQYMALEFIAGESWGPPPKEAVWP
jgi:DNA-binding LacI/PurR family transcriptional regulator